MHQHTELLLAAIVFIGIGCHWLAWQVKLPAIIFLLLAGIIAGPVTGLVQPDALFGELLFPFVSLGVAVILFEGGLTLKLHDIRGLRKAVLNLLTLGVLLTWGIAAVAARLLLDFSWELALLFGALMTVTGPTVIKPLLRTMRPKSEIAKVLHWESIILDPVGALLTVLVYQFIVSSQPGHEVSLTFFATLVTGILSGVAGAYLLALLLRHHLIPHYLRNVFSLVLVLMVFALSNTLHSESGLLAVTLMGMMLANMKNVDIEDILFFKESLSVLLISMLFIVLAARLEFAPLMEIGWAAAGMLAVIMFIARPVSVLSSTVGSQLDWRARTLLCWVAPRGIVAAAVSALFALRLGEFGYEGASVLVPLTFLIIIGTVFIQGITARPLAHLLKVAEPEPRGVLIVGANPVARHLAKALNQLDIPVMLADTGWENVRAARMEGFNTYFGRVVSEHADRHMDMAGIGKLLALSPHSTLNALACIRFKPEFGSGNIFRLQTSQDEQEEEKKAEHPSFTGRRLFGEEVTLATLLSLISQGAEIHTTTLSEDFDYTRYWEKYQHRATPLFAIDPQERLYFITTDEKLQLKPGWKIASLLPAEEGESSKEEARKFQPKGSTSKGNPAQKHV